MKCVGSKVGYLLASVTSRICFRDPIFLEIASEHFLFRSRHAHPPIADCLIIGDPPQLQVRQREESPTTRLFRTSPCRGCLRRNYFQPRLRPAGRLDKSGIRSLWQRDRLVKRGKICDASSHSNRCLAVGWVQYDLFLAGLQGIRQELYEAAAVDGANWWQAFIHVTLPSLRPVIAFVFVVSMIGSLATL